MLSSIILQNVFEWCEFEFYLNDGLRNLYVQESVTIEKGKYCVDNFTY
jgi:hypothetical protein